MNNQFCDLTLHYNLKLWQALSVKKQHKLKNSLKFIILKIKINVLTLKVKTDSITQDCWQLLTTDKQKLVFEELSKCQKHQLSRLLTSLDDAELMKYHCSQFHCIHCLMSECNWLTSNLFIITFIWSDEGQSVLHNMITFCLQNAEVLFCLSLKSEKCTCLITGHKLKLNMFMMFSLLFA